MKKIQIIVDARLILDNKLKELPEDSRIYSSLGIIYAGLGMNKEALETGEKALFIVNIHPTPLEATTESGICPARCKTNS